MPARHTGCPESRRPYVLAHPITLDVSFKNRMPAEVLSYLRSVERTDARSIRYVGRDMQEISDFFNVVNEYSADLAP